MKLFERYDKVFCINLSKRPDRLDNFKSEVEKHNLGEFVRFEAVDGDLLKINSKLLKGEIGINQSIINLMELSIRENYNHILIIEDDCVFNENIKQLNDYLPQVPNDWDMLYFGGNHNTHMGTIPPFPVNKNIVRLHTTYAAHCIAIKKHMFPIILKEIKKFESPLDVSYQKLQKNHKIYGLNPGVATQMKDYSDIQKKEVNYDWLIK